MADEFAKLSSKNKELIEKLEKAVGQIAELKNQICKLNHENAELKEKIRQGNSSQSAKSSNSIPTLMPKKRPNNESNNLVAKMDAKRSKLFANCVPNWLVEVLAWIKRIEMAESFLPTSCRTFNQLCWPKLHGKNVKPHMASRLTFSHLRDKLSNIHASLKHSKYSVVDEDNNAHFNYPFDFPIPIPCVPPPPYIQSFKQITLEFLNGELVEFINGILPSMKNVNIAADMDMGKWKDGDKCVSLMNHLFDVLRYKIFEISFNYPIEDFCRLFPDFFNHAEKLWLPDDNIQNEKEIAFLIDWLANPPRTGHSKQKHLTFSYFSGKKPEHDFIDRLVEQFTNASQPQLYFVSLGWSDQIPDAFTLENEQTGEVLALYYKTHPRYNVNNKFLVRYPKNEEDWKEVGEKESQNQEWPLNTIYLDIKKFAI